MTGPISPLQLFLEADLVVKTVVLLLLAASLWSWMIIFESSWRLRQLRRAIATDGRSGGPTAKALLQIFANAQLEAEAQGDIADRFIHEASIAAVMKRRAQELVESCQARVHNLAVIASVAPFVGLFGTVWGIMSSFAGIAAAKDTSLAVVAPGIAEALAATAIGLAAAIPAAFAYNRFATSFSRTSRHLSRLIEDNAAIIVRDQRSQSPTRRAA